MAFDEYCLRHHDADEPVFYLWQNRPSVIIGLNQNAYSEVNLGYINSHGILLARRVTGGGAVYHDLQNLNYSFIGKSPSPEPIAEALRKMGVNAELSGRNDIYVDGRKVSGYARRIWHDRELVHGTLMFNVDIETMTAALSVKGSKLEAKGIASVHSRVANLKEYLPQFRSVREFCGALHSILAGNDAEVVMEDKASDSIKELAEQKFSTWEWIYGHSKEASFIRKAKLPCGTVEAAITLDQGRISAVCFSGDFIGDIPAEFIAERLKGIRFDRESILSALQDSEVQSAFTGVSASDIADLMTSRQ